MIKPNKEEQTIITILISIMFGLLIGVWSMKQEVREIEKERDLLILHTEELIESNNGLVDIMIQSEVNK
tara:strand:+ start:1089 stop:1295 length:207 start_codon:yes stop_codon:yes gene_type:complete